MAFHFPRVHSESSSGFTLIEILVVTSITVLIGGFLVANFSRSRVDLNQVVLTVADAIREAQSSALAGSLVRGEYRCGYGIHFTEKGYSLYAGPDSSTNDCASEDRNFNKGIDEIIRSGVLPNNTLEIALPASDIFFEPPNPTTFINGSSTEGITEGITIQRKGAKCPSADCRIITVSTAGRIEVQ
jgi:Tfp pilus assembly protein FimT